MDKGWASREFRGETEWWVKVKESKRANVARETNPAVSEKQDLSLSASFCNFERHGEIKINQD